MVTEFSDDAYWKCPYTGRLFSGASMDWYGSIRKRLAGKL